MKRARLVLHGDREQGDQLITRMEIVDNGELAIDTWSGPTFTSLTYSQAEMREMHAFLGRALAAKKGS